MRVSVRVYRFVRKYISRLKTVKAEKCVCFDVQGRGLRKCVVGFKIAVLGSEKVPG